VFFSEHNVYSFRDKSLETMKPSRGRASWVNDYQQYKCQCYIVNFASS